jgi:hypothetical protein
VNDKLERIWKKQLWPNFMVLSWHLAGGTEESHEKPQLG